MKLHLFKGEPLVRMDSQSMRRYLMDKDGRIYDTLQDVIFKGNPCIRVSLHLPWAFFPKNIMRSAAQVWDAPPEVVSTVEAFLGEVTAYWLSGDGPRGKSIKQYPLFWHAEVKNFQDFVEASNTCRLWQVLCPVFKWDFD